jgi:hypothetical protein
MSLRSSGLLGNRDLASIYEYLSERSPRGSANVMVAIYAAIEFIRHNPYAAELTTIRGVRGIYVERVFKNTDLSSSIESARAKA